MIKKYRKKPVIIDAIQLTSKNIRDVYTFIHSAPDTRSRIASDRWDDYEEIVKREGLRLKTMESDNETQKADIGDWIIKGVKGEFYPCKPDIFKLLYESVRKTTKKRRVSSSEPWDTSSKGGV